MDIRLSFIMHKSGCGLGRLLHIIVLVLGACILFAGPREAGAAFTRADTESGIFDAANGNGVAWADFDNDSDLDLFVANSSGQADSLYRNNGNGTFTEVSAAAGMTGTADGFGVAWGDYDNDGDLDLFVATSGQDILYKNNGGGVFTDVAASAGMTDAVGGFGAAWADYDADGDLDLFVANTGTGQDFLYRNNGNGTFSNVATSAGMTDAANGAVAAWADYDNDGDLDLYVVNSGGDQDFLYKNNGYGAFTRVDTSVGMMDASNGVGAAWGDYDADGDLDLFVANQTAQEDFLYRNNGDGTFTRVDTTVGINVASYGLSPAWGDYDNDGDLDLFLTNDVAQQDILYRNNGNGAFTRVDTALGIIDALDAGGSAWADYDNDGDLDLYAANWNGQQDYLYRNAGPVQNWIKVITLTDSNGNARESDPDSDRLDVGAKVEVDLDGSADFAVGTGRYASLLITSGSGFGRSAIPAHLGVGSATTVDVRVTFSDGDVWIETGVAVNQTITVRDPPRFVQSAQLAGLNDAAFAYGSAWGDYDGDGDLDLFVANDAGEQDFLYRNNGNGTFTNVAVAAGMSDASYGIGPAWGDYDNDGDLDLFVANWSGQQDFLYKNNGNGTFTSAAASAGMTDTAHGYGAAWGDYDGDGDLDLFVANGSTTAQDFLYRNNGSGTFTNVGMTALGTDASDGKGAAWADYDNDGDLDLFVCNWGAQNFLYRNDGGGAFTNVAATVGLPESSNSTSAAWGDFDGDGDFDLYVTTSGPQDLFYRNNGNGTFTRADTTVGFVDAHNGHGAAWADFDGDGDLDLFVCNYSSLQDFLYRNNGNDSFTNVAKAQGVDAGNFGIGPAWADYDNDGDLDLFVADANNVQDFLYKNSRVNAKKWLKVVPLTDSNHDAEFSDGEPDRLAIGAKVEIDLNGGANFDTGIGKYTFAAVGSGQGPGQSAAPLHFMLDTVATVDVRVTFPDGDTALVANVAANQTITVKDPAQKLFMVSGNHQLGAAGGSLASPLVVKVFHPVGGAIAAPVTFSVSNAPDGASGYSPATTVMSNAATGLASFNFTLGAKNGVYRVTASVGSQSVTFTAYTDRVDVAAGKWKMGGPVKKPSDGSLAGVIEDDGFGSRETTGKGTLTSGYRIYRWDPTAGVDPNFSRFKVPSIIESAKSYWFKAASAGALDVDGTALTDTFELRLDQGWNMTANPFAFFIDWDSDVRFETFPVAGEAVAPKTPSQARSDSIADDVTFWFEDPPPAPVGYRWGPRSISYGAPLVASLQLKPWVGYWVYAHRSCTMVFHPNPRDPASAAVVTQAPRLLSASYGAVTTGDTAEWTIQLSLSGLRSTASGLQKYEDAENFVGVRRSGMTAVRDAPASPGGVNLSVSRPGGEAPPYALLYLPMNLNRPASSGGWFSSWAFADEGEQSPAWELSSYSADAGDVTILADNVQNVPSAVPLLLRDESTGIVTDLRRSPSYSYFSAPGESRRLLLSAGTAGSGPLTSIKYPAACLITRLVGSDRKSIFAALPSGIRLYFLTCLRQARDAFLQSALGRHAVCLYYKL